MLLRLSSNTLMNTVIMDSRNLPLYHISTSTGTFRAGPTRIFRVGGDPFGNGEIAAIHWHAYRKTKVVYGGREMDIRSFMQSGGRSHGKRTMIGPNGTRYIWKRRWGKPADLIRPAGQGKGGKKRIMRLSTSGFFGSRTTIEIDHEGEHMLEQIIIAAACMERQRLGANAASQSNSVDGWVAVASAAADIEVNLTS